MRKHIILVLIIIYSIPLYSQKFDLNMMEKLTRISFTSIDNFMIDGYGFNKIKEENNGFNRTYARFFDNNYDNTIIISVIYLKDKPNMLDISVAKNYNIRSIKDKILDNGYEYNGTNPYGLIIFKKGKFAYLIAKEPNKVGATQIMLINQ